MKKITLLLLSLTPPLILSAQDPTIPPVDLTNITPENLLTSLYEPLYGALVILFGYLSAFIPGIKKINAFGRVLAFGLVAGLGAYLFGGASVWKIGLSFLISTGLIYDGFLKPLGGMLKKKAAATR